MHIELEKVCISLIWNLEESLLTRLLPTISIPFTICTISRNKFKRHYLKNKKLFLDFLLHFLHVHEIQNILKKKMRILA